MRKLVVSEFLTLDGVMQDPGGAEGMARGGWSMPYWHDDIGAIKSNELMASDALLLGRVTYEGFAAAWPERAGDDDFADRMNAIAKHVVSSTLHDPTWNNTQVIAGGAIAARVNALKAQEGQDILVAGSAQLVQALIAAKLVDEYRLLVYPVVVGEGKRLFQDGADATLTLVESRPIPTGVTLLRYAPAK